MQLQTRGRPYRQGGYLRPLGRPVDQATTLLQASLLLYPVFLGVQALREYNTDVMLMVTMSRILSQLLDAREPNFSHTLQDLERESGHPNLDIHVSAEISQLVRQKTRELGLNPRDTSGEELYIALQDLIAIHDRFIANSIGVAEGDDTDAILRKIKSAIDGLTLPKSCWALKPSVVRRLLKSMPPKRVMKLMHYRSVDSMLKRESVTEVLGAARLVESRTWMQQYMKGYRGLQPTDFETRDMELMVLDSERYRDVARGFIAKKRRNLAYLKEMGTILLLPLPQPKLPGASITLLPLVLYYMNELRFYSSYFKFNQVRPDFALLLIDALESDVASAVTLQGQPLHWRVVQRHFGKRDASHNPEAFQPYIQHEDFEWKSAQDILYKFEPALKFWEGLDYVGFIDGKQTVSLNLLDNAIGYCNGLEYGSQTSAHLKSSLWSELWSRYMDEQTLKEQVLAQLESQTASALSFNLEETIVL